jgi:multidrug resistance protein, MATE family
MLCAEWWAFEIFNIFSGYLSVDIQAAQVILWNFLLLTYQVAKGFSEGICALVGSSIGANKVELGKRIKKVTLTIAWIACIIEACIMYLFRVQIAQLYTAD